MQPNDTNLILDARTMPDVQTLQLLLEGPKQDHQPQSTSLHGIETRCMQVSHVGHATRNRSDMCTANSCNKLRKLTPKRTDAPRAGRANQQDIKTCVLRNLTVSPKGAIDATRSSTDV